MHWLVFWEHDRQFNAGVQVLHNPNWFNPYPPGQTEQEGLQLLMLAKHWLGLNGLKAYPATQLKQNDALLIEQVEQGYWQLGAHGAWVIPVR